MIKLIMKGGLGNQMFQYATGYSVAKHNNYKLEIDLSFLKNRIPIPGFTIRNYELDLFGISNLTATLFSNQFLDKYFSYPIEKIFIKTKILRSYMGQDFYKFDKKVFDIPGNSLLEGDFNNYRYFAQYSLDIKNIFNTDKLFDNSYKDIESLINSTNSVSINIRRGDYLNSKHKDVFVFLDANYYKQAISKIREKVENPHFFIFSIDFPEGNYSYFINELGLKKEEITLLGKTYTGEKFKTYLRLISLCKHNIIANSTFSFWGAYLNKNIEKQVVCPTKWAYDQSDFEVPVDWIAIKN